MSLSRRGVAVAWRLRALCAPAAQSGLGSGAESTSTTAAHASSAAFSSLPTFSPEQPHSGGSNWRQTGPHAYSYFGSRNFSVVPESRDGEDLTSIDGSSTAGAALDSGADAGAGIFTDISTQLSSYSPDSIVNLTAIAEKAALESAAEGCWAPTRALQWYSNYVNPSAFVYWIFLSIAKPG